MRASPAAPRFLTTAALLSLVALAASCAGEDADTGEAELTTFALTCPSGTHVCGNSCVTNNSALNCGLSCTPCPVPRNGVAVCAAGRCLGQCAAGYKLCNNACVPAGSSCGPTTCAAGFHYCGGLCVSNTSVNACGTSCTTCPAPANGSATCNGSGCGLTCAAGFKVCNGACIPVSSSCGPTTCAAGFHYCGGVCVSNTSVNGCGTSCTACPAPANGSATCNGTTCGVTCAAGFKACRQSCIPNSSSC